MYFRVRALAACLRTALFAALICCASGGTAAAEAVLYRIFLTDGSTITSYGEYARVAGRVVFSMPLTAGGGENPRLQLVTLEESSVDWNRTERYAESVRATRYAETRGEEEFTRLSAEIARTLSDVAMTNDPSRRLAIADRARKMLAEWPASNYGYRAQDVAQLSTLLDEVVSELRVAAGLSRFDLTLVANTATPPPVPLLAPPSFRESIEQAFTAARLTPDSTDRISLLSAVVEALSPARAESWAAGLHARASADLAAEIRADKAYARLAARTLRAADARLKRADVAGLETLVRTVLETDDRLGRRRPQATGALLATLDARLAAARRFRLARDTWVSRQKMLRSYRESIAPAVEQFRRATPGLQEIRQLAGPSSDVLSHLAERAARGMQALARLRPAPELQTIHGMLASAFQMAAQAINTRQNAIRMSNMEIAWQAASAAAGALLMFERVNQELEKLAVPPAL